MFFKNLLYDVLFLYEYLFLPWLPFIMSQLGDTVDGKVLNVDNYL